MSFWSGKRIVVTGGEGFIGRHVCDAIKRTGAPDPFVVRHRDYDLCQPEDVSRLFNEHPADIVIHLAGLVGGILANKERPADFYFQNLMVGTLVLHYAWKNGVQKVLAAGAGCGYPLTAPNPLNETDIWNGFPQPESAPYSLAKKMLIIQSDAYERQHGFVSMVAIPGNVYGPYDNFNLNDAHVIPALVRKFVEATDTKADSVEVWGTGQAARDFVYGADVAEGFLRALEVYDHSTVVNLSSGHETSIKEVVTLLQKVTGFGGEIRWNADRPDGQKHRRFDISKAKTDLGWAATTSLEEGLRTTVDWYRTHSGEARR